MSIQDITPWLESIQYLAIIFGTFFAVFQYSYSKRTRRQEKAADIMIRYKDAITKIAGVEAALSGNKSINNIVEKIDRRSPLSFALYERKEYGVTESDEKKYMSFLENSNISDIHTTIGDIRVSYDEVIPRHIHSSLPESCSLGQLSTITLNDIEHICMVIESGAVDDQYVYGALHQTLLPFIHSMAILLQSINKSSLTEENFYPYTIKLYNRWVIKESKNYKKMKKKLKAKSDKRLP